MDLPSSPLRYEFPIIDFDDEYQEFESIPDTYDSLLPPPHISVSSLIESYAFNTTSIGASTPLSLAFSEEGPALGPFSSSDLAIPYLGLKGDFVMQLGAKARQEWLAGKRSVIIKGCPVSLPFWVLAFWKKAICAMEAKRQWIKAKAWLKKNIHLVDTPKPFQETVLRLQNILDTVQWKSTQKMGKCLLDPYFLTELFASDQISSSVIDAVMNLISNRVANTSHIRHTLVEGLRMEYGLHADAKEWERYDDSKDLKSIRRISDRIREENVKALIFPTLVHGNHWVIFEIDFENKIISYGDSTSKNPLRSDLLVIERWLKQIGYPMFPLRRLKHGHQDDGYSCGVMVWNMVEHRLFSDALWTTETKHLLRVSYACRLLDLASGNIYSTIPESVSTRS